MKAAEQTIEDIAGPEVLKVGSENIITLPLGLLGLESFKKYVLLSEPDDEPFLWLQVIDDPGLAFLVVSPFVVLPDYAPEISEEDSQFLGLDGPEDALIFNIVTLHDDGPATMNLKGPLVINRYTLKGKQSVISNAAEYQLKHPLPVE